MLLFLALISVSLQFTSCLPANPVMPSFNRLRDVNDAAVYGSGNQPDTSPVYRPRDGMAAPVYGPGNLADTPPHPGSRDGIAARVYGPGILADTTAAPKALSTPPLPTPTAGTSVFEPQPGGGQLPQGPTSFVTATPTICPATYVSNTASTPIHLATHTPPGFVTQCEENCLASYACRHVNEFWQMCAPDQVNTTASPDWEKDNTGIWDCFCNTELHYQTYPTALQQCNTCLAGALAYDTSLHLHNGQDGVRSPLGPDGLEATVWDAFQSYCSQGYAERATSFKQYMSKGEEITKCFGSPVLFWNYTVDANY